MNVILEGPDATGKTTLAEKLKKKYGMSVHHSTTKTRNDLAYHIDLLDYRTNTVFDRFSVGEYVFPKIYNRPDKLAAEDFTTIDKRIIDNNDMFIIFVCSDLSILNERLIARGEDSYIPEMAEQNRLFTEYANRFKHGFEEAPVPGLDQQGAGVGRGDGGHLEDRGIHSVVADRDGAQHGGVGAARADRRQLAVERLAGLFHLVLKFRVIRHRFSLRFQTFSSVFR